MNLLTCRLFAFVGIITFLLIAFLFSKDKKNISIKLVLSALLMQFGLAFLILKTEFGRKFFESISFGFSSLYGFADVGASFIFGNLSNMSGAWGMIFFIKVVPIIIFFGALTSLLFHLGVIQILVKGLSFLLQPLFGTSGAETLCAVGNSMLSQTETPLLIKSYLKNMGESEILLIMISGMSTLSGAIIAVYGAIGVPIIHLVAASIMSIPGAILISKILAPKINSKEKTNVDVSVDSENCSVNIFDAIASGTIDGMKVAACVVAVLISFVSLIAMLDFFINFSSFYLVGRVFSLNEVFGSLFSSVTFLLGIPIQDRIAAGALVGQKLVINEFIAYSNFVKMELDYRTKIILIYALCGFANFSSIGIQIGGIGALAPNQKGRLAKLGLKAVLGSTLVNFLNAAIVSLIL